MYGKVRHRLTLKARTREGKEAFGGGGALDEVVLQVEREGHKVRLNLNFNHHSRLRRDHMEYLSKVKAFFDGKNLFVELRQI